jgi:cobalt-precorrin 5A hydrolase
LGFVAVSKQGARLAQRLLNAEPSADAFVPGRFLRNGAEPEDDRLRVYEGRVAPVIERLFEQRRPMVLIMAVGAAVRLVAPLLSDKLSDPPVVVLDDAARYCVSLIGGHASGANRLAEQIARYSGAQAVITTASEIAGAPAIESIAAGLGWRIEAGPALTRVAATLVNGDACGVYQDCGSIGWRLPYAKQLPLYDGLDSLVRAHHAAAIVVTDRVLELPDALQGRTLILRPATLVLGVGCSSGVDAKEIADLVDSALSHAGLSPLSVDAVATLDRKAGEPGLKALAQSRGWPVLAYSADELDAAPGQWTHSDIVNAAVGTHGVAEPAALLASGADRLAVTKVKSARVTVAVARRPSVES